MSSSGRNMRSSERSVKSSESSVWISGRSGRSDMNVRLEGGV